ncbi:hypothetical protein ACFLZW_06290 [Chloroflexota bacterium]
MINTPSIVIWLLGLGAVAQLAFCGNCNTNSRKSYNNASYDESSQRWGRDNDAALACVPGKPSDEQCQDKINADVVAFDISLYNYNLFLISLLK